MEKNSPKLRFPEFNEEWEMKRIDEIAPLQRGFDLPVNDIINGEFPVVFSNGILKHHNNFKVKAPGVVTGRSGTIGKVTYVETDFWPHNTSLWVTDFKGNLPLFVYYFYFRYNLERFGTGSGVPTLNRNDIHLQKEYFPSLPQQTKIANFLTAVDDKLSQLKKKKGLLEQYKKGVMQKIFSQELRFKDENGGDFAEWEEKKLGVVCDVRDGTHDSPKYHETGYPFITSKNLQKDGSIDFDNVSFINESDYNKFNGRSKVDINDILFGMIGTIGNPVLVKRSGFAIKNVALIKQKIDLLNIFLIHFLNGDSISQQFFEQNTGGTQKFLSLSIIRNLIVEVPSIQEQIKITNFLTAIDDKINRCGNQIEKMETWKKGLLQGMFV